MKYAVLMVGCLMVLAGCEAERDPSSLFGPDASGVLVVDAFADCRFNPCLKC